MSDRNAPNKNGVSIEPTKNTDPGPGGKVPLPDDHARECVGDKCWCRSY